MSGSDKRLWPCVYRLTMYWYMRFKWGVLPVGKMRQRSFSLTWRL